MKGIKLLYFFLACTTTVFAEVNECPPEQETDWGIEQLLRHEDCNKFYKCTFGKPVEYKCYGDLYFNLDTWQCDWQENVDCTGRNVPDPTTTAQPGTTPEPTTLVPTTPEPTTPEPTTPEPTTPEPTTPEPTTPEPTTPEPTTPEPTTPEPTTPEPTTPEPTTPEPTTPEPTTPEPTTPEPTTPEPTTPEPTTPEPTTPEPTTPEPTTPEPTTTWASELEFLPNGCPVDPHIHWLLPHEEECTLFYYCVWGRLVLRECSPGTHFNRVLQVCDWPHHAGCTTALNQHIFARRGMLSIA